MFSINFSFNYSIARSWKRKYFDSGVPHTVIIRPKDKLNFLRASNEAGIYRTIKKSMPLFQKRINEIIQLSELIIQKNLRKAELKEKEDELLNMVEKHKESVNGGIYEYIRKIKGEKKVPEKKP